MLHGDYQKHLKSLSYPIKETLSGITADVDPYFIE